MTKTLRALVAEDQVDDYDLLLLALRQAGYDVESRRIQDHEEMVAALRDAAWDIVFSDWSMPSFTALDALGVLRDSGLDLPFIIVSGTVGEDTAVEALRRGAHDFLVKHRMARLSIAVERELREAAVRREKARMHEQLMISDRMASVGILAAGVAHEINNPLAAVISNLDLALEDLGGVNTEDPTLASILESVSDARTAAQRVKNIVRDLRIFSRSDDEETGAVAVDKVVESTLRMAANELRHRARVIKRFNAVPPVAASEARLGQVFLNLVVNAAQAMPEGHAHENELCVTIAMDGHRVRIDIGDTGPGIPPEVMKRLFTPFVTTKPKGIGTGLGLSICHRLVTSFGGELTASTNSTGTTFTVLLPLWHGGASVETTTQISPIHGARRGKVLVVDDDAIVAKSVLRTLATDHDLTTADSGRRALELLQRGSRFDVILCDVMMPEMTGPELYDEVLRLAPEQAKAMVFLTGGVFTTGAKEFLERVNNPRIEKPFDAPALRALVNEWVR